MRLTAGYGIDSLLCSPPTDTSAPRAFSSFLCESWWCILPLRKFTFHPYGSMACVGAWAIAVSGVQFRTGYEYRIWQPHARRICEVWERHRYRMWCGLAVIIAGFGSTVRL